MSDRLAEHRDERIAAALAELAVPEHEPGFFEQLQAVLAREEDRRRRRERRWGLLARRRFRWTLRLAVVAGLAAGLLLAVGLPHGAKPARAAEIKASVRRAVAQATSLEGRIVYRALNPQTRRVETTRFAFAADAEGDFRLRQLGGPSDLAYEAATGTEAAINTSASIGTGRFFSLRRGLPPGPPDQGPSDFLLGRALGATVRALLAARDPHIRAVTSDGRPAWQLDFALRPNRIFPDADRLAVTVDRASALPVRVVSTLGGSFRSALRIEGLRVGKGPGRLSPGTFRVPIPAGAGVLRTDEGFRRVGLEEARRRVGYAPLVPGWLPRGFRLAGVSVARQAGATAGGRNPDSRKVVAVEYRRGFDQLIVTTRLRGAAGARWRDPFSVEGIFLRSSAVHVSEGALRGAQAGLVLDPRSLPHLWALTDRLVVTVSGDLSRSELLRLAGSLLARTHA